MSSKNESWFIVHEQRVYLYKQVVYFIETKFSHLDRSVLLQQTDVAA